MNKKLLTAAIAAGLMAPGLAAADVKLYGIAQVEYNVEDTDATGQNSVQSVDDDGVRSRIGIKFSEKLGNGLKVFGKYEWAMDPSDSSSSGATDDAANFRTRDAHVGLKGSWGSIAMGSFHAPYKTAGGVKWDPWTATHLQARRAGGMFGGAGIGGTNGFMRNAIYYTSPKMNGFKVQFAISPDETNAGGTENIANGDNDYSVAVQYKSGAWHAIFAHNRNNNPSTVAGGDETLTKFGLRWKGNGFTLAGQYEKVNDADRAATGGNVSGLGGTNYRPGTGDDADILWLNGQYKMGNNIFTISWANMDVDETAANGGSNVDFDYWAVGVIHKFSKQTRVFAGYTQTNGDNQAAGATADRDAWTVGIRKDF